jgi:hypothetical protein
MIAYDRIAFDRIAQHSVAQHRKSSPEAAEYQIPCPLI